MNIVYKGETLKYIEDFHGEPVLWITNPSQRSMEHMTFVGGYPNEYCIYLKDLPKTDIKDIKSQVTMNMAKDMPISNTSKIHIGMGKDEIINSINSSDYYNPNISKEVFLQRLKEDDEFSPGWQAIDDAFEELYGNQKPYHLATDLHARAISGGDQYLDGYSIYQSSKGYKHIVTYGMTILYGDENAYGGEWNGWGYEMTIKLKETENDDCVWAVNMMSNLARYTYRSNRFFEPYQFVKGDGASLRIGTDSKITALLLVPDTEAKPRQTVYGRTEFLQLVGITQKELEFLIEDPSKAKTLAELMLADGNIDLVTDMARTKSYF